MGFLSRVKGWYRAKKASKRQVVVEAPAPQPVAEPVSEFVKDGRPYVPRGRSPMIDKYIASQTRVLAEQGLGEKLDEVEETIRFSDPVIKLAVQYGLIR